MKLEVKTRDTEPQFDEVISHCRALFEEKTRDYGTAWRILRPPSVTDQIFIKAQRIRSIQEKGVNKVGDDIKGEFIGIINYSVMAILQTGWARSTSNAKTRLDLNVEQALFFYDDTIKKTKELLFAKNHDYGEAWRDMRVASMVDIILMKLLRTKQIENNDGKTLVSEGVEANYRDMINYAIFCLIKMTEVERET